MNAKIPVRSAHIDYEHLYERIKMYRKEKNIKQHEIAIQLGYEPANYGKIGRGDRPMSLSVLAEICLILEVPLEEMLKGCLIGGNWKDAPQISCEKPDIGRAFQLLLDGKPRKTVDLALALCQTLVHEMEKSPQAECAKRPQS